VVEMEGKYPIGRSPRWTYRTTWQEHQQQKSKRQMMDLSDHIEKLTLVAAAR
jgi:hypothetical protein